VRKLGLPVDLAVQLPATIGVMQRCALIAVAIAVFSAALGTAQTKTGESGPQKEAAPDVPDAIAVSSGEEVVLFARGVGSQIYTCQAGPDGKFAWALKAPEADLHDRNDKVIGQHFAGPTWKLKDGSEIVGKAAAKVDSLDPESIPWLLLKVVSHSGSGLLNNVTDIQRLHTHGGHPPSEGCDAAHKGTETKSSYTADYYFYAPAK
jgi:hypothetical protein